IDNLLERVESKYELVIYAAKRARQINDYYSDLHEGNLFDNVAPLVDSSVEDKPLTIALHEINEDKLRIRHAEWPSHREPPTSATVCLRHTAHWRRAEPGPMRLSRFGESMSALRLFTSESVTEGHPDKICDQISDSILDGLLTVDRDSRVAVETLVTTGLVHVAGEIRTEGYVDIPTIVRDVVNG